MGSVGEMVWAGSLSLSSLSLLATAGPAGMALVAGGVQSPLSDEEEQKRFSTRGDGEMRGGGVSKSMNHIMLGGK